MGWCVSSSTWTFEVLRLKLGPQVIHMPHMPAIQIVAQVQAILLKHALHVFTHRLDRSSFGFISHFQGYSLSLTLKGLKWGNTSPNKSCDWVGV